MLVEVGSYSYHIFAVARVAFGAVSTVGLKNKKDVVVNGSFYDKVEVTFALVAKNRGEAVDLVYSEFAELELHIELQCGSALVNPATGLPNHSGRRITAGNDTRPPFAIRVSAAVLHPTCSATSPQLRPSVRRFVSSAWCSFCVSLHKNTG